MSLLAGSKFHGFMIRTLKKFRRRVFLLLIKASRYGWPRVLQFVLSVKKSDNFKLTSPKIILYVIIIIIYIYIYVYIHIWAWLEYGNPYPYLISFSTGNHIRSQCLPIPVFHFFPYGNPYPYLISYSTGNMHIRSQCIPVSVFHFLPCENLRIRVSVTREYVFPCGKKWKTSTARYW